MVKAEWHPGELFPRVGFVVTTLTVSDGRVFEFYNRRGTAEQYIKEGKYALKWTRLSCKSFAANEVRLQLHALAYMGLTDQVHERVLLKSSALPHASGYTF